MSRFRMRRREKPDMSGCTVLIATFVMFAAVMTLAAILGGLAG
jgi:hypothetical protein